MNMRVLWRLLTLLTIGHYVLINSAVAEVPELVNYQGRLLDGTNLVNGTVALSLRLFDQPISGHLLYEDSNSVTVADGLYSTFIGDNTTFGTLTNALVQPFDIYIEVMVDGAALAPRERLAAVAFALNAKSAQSAEGVAANAITASMIATGAIQSFNLAPGSVTSLALADGSVTSNKLAANAVTTAALSDGAVSGAKIASNTVTSANIADDSLLVSDLYQIAHPGLIGTFTNPAPTAGDYFGASVCSVGSNYFAVGAPFAFSTAIDAGRVSLYTSAGVLVTNIGNPAPFADDYFGWVLADVGSDRFAVGTPFDDAGAQAAGSVYIYNTNGVLVGFMTNPVPVLGDEFGYGLAGVGTNLVAIGTPYFDDGVASNCGRVYIYTLSGALVTTITNPTPAVFDSFGISVCGVGSNLIVVGAPGDNTGIAFSGSVYLYRTNGALLATIPNPAPATQDFFGGAVANLGSSLFVVAAYQDSAGTQFTGSAYIYNTNGTLLATITNPSPDALDFFGSSLSGIGSNYFVVGCRSDPGGANIGSVYLYDASGNLLASLPNENSPDDDQFGDSVAGIGAGMFVVGAPQADAPVLNDSGRAYLYRLGDIVPSLVADSVADGSVGVNQLDTEEVDARYVRKSGDTMTGTLFLPAHGLSVGSSQLVVNSVGGFIGIGTFNPTAKLDVRGDTSVSGTITALSLDLPMGGLQVGVTQLVAAGNGNVGIGTSNPTNRLHVVGTVQATAYITGSDRNSKENIAPVSVADILERVSKLPISTWTFRDESSGLHLGPMAQDFHDAFGLGNTDSGIFTVDADGVALAAIQALARENAELKSELEALRAQQQAEILELKRQMEALRSP